MSPTSDPRLTAKVLGELSAEELAALTVELEADDQLKALVNDLEFAAQFSRDAFAERQDDARLTDDQRERILCAAESLSGEESHVATPRRSKAWSKALVYAAIVLVLIGIGLVEREIGRTPPLPPNDLARLSTDELSDAPNTIQQRTENEAIVNQWNAPSPSGGPQGQQFGGRYDAFGDLRDLSAVAPPSSTPSPTEEGVNQLGTILQKTPPANDALPQIGLQQTSNFGISAPTEHRGTEFARIGQNGTAAGQFDPALGKQRNWAWHDTDGNGIVDYWFYNSTPQLGDDQRRYLSLWDSTLGDGVELHDNFEVRTQVQAESYALIAENNALDPVQHPLSTFALDVDTASYTNVRRMLNDGALPPPDAVRVEEFMNYFDYEYAAPGNGDPLGVQVEMSDCPWNPQLRLGRIAVKAREPYAGDRQAANLVFLIDVSGSMDSPDKLPLLRESMKLMVGKLSARDKVAIVTYRDTVETVLDSTPCDSDGGKQRIIGAIDTLHAEGSTNGEGGLSRAYDVAEQHLMDGGINRVVLATDGDFNVGQTNEQALVDMLQAKVKKGIFLSVLGFGTGNLKDCRLEAIADRCNGAYYYIDSYREAERVLSTKVAGTLEVVAKDAKIQVEFNPAKVISYRLIGYENRSLAPRDFNDDAKDAGDIGAGLEVTALYEIAPAGSGYRAPGVDTLKYQRTHPPAEVSGSDEIMTVKLRFKQPNADESVLREFPVVDSGQGYDQASRDFRWAVAAAGFGMLLRNSQHGGEKLTLDLVREIAEEARGFDPDGQRAEFIQLVVAAKTLSAR